MKQVFAVADKVPEGHERIRAGREYEVIAEIQRAGPDGAAFVIVDESGNAAEYFWSKSGSIGYRDWTRIERDTSGLVVSDEVVRGLVEEHQQWAALFGAAIIDAMQGDYEAFNYLARSMEIEFPDGAPALKSAALAAAKGAAK